MASLGETAKVIYRNGKLYFVTAGQSNAAEPLQEIILDEPNQCEKIDVDGAHHQKKAPMRAILLIPMIIIIMMGKTKRQNCARKKLKRKNFGESMKQLQCLICIRKIYWTLKIIKSSRKRRKCGRHCQRP